MESTRCDDAELVRVATHSVKTFRRLLRKRGWNTGMNFFQVIQVIAKRSTETFDTKEELLSAPHPKLNRILLPKRSVDREIYVDKDSEPAHLPLHNLSPADLYWAKIHVEDLLRKGKLRPSNLRTALRSCLIRKWTSR